MVSIKIVFSSYHEILDIIKVLKEKENKQPYYYIYETFVFFFTKRHQHVLILKAIYMDSTHDFMISQPHSYYFWRMENAVAPSIFSFLKSSYDSAK